MLHRFSGNPDGQWPEAPVIRDSKGNIYGTTWEGGIGYGTIFEIDAAKKERVLYRFTGGTDGCYPWQGLIRDNAGNLYGTTASTYQTCGYGTIFKLTPKGQLTTLYNFCSQTNCADGAYPYNGHLTMDKYGNLYGVTTSGGAGIVGGVLYKLSKTGELTVLHSFSRGTTDGDSPYGTVAMDKAGNLYGTTVLGGSSGNGTIWKVSQKGKETILHNFAGGTSDGCNPGGERPLTRMAICMGLPKVAEPTTPGRYTS